MDGIHFTELDAAASGDDTELLVLRVVPMLSLGDAGLGDIDRDLSALRRMEKLRKTAALVTMHRDRIRELIFGEIREIGRVELLREAVRLIGHHQILRLVMERVKEVGDLAEGARVTRFHRVGVVIRCRCRAEIAIFY